MKLITAALVMIGACFLLASPASSQTYDYARIGGYVGVSVIGGSYTRFDDELEDQLAAIGYIVSSDTDEVVGFNLYGGYRIHPHFAFEAEFEMLPNADQDISGLGKIAELDTWALTGNVKAFLLKGRTQPYALFGIGVMEADLEDSVGVGLDVTETDFAMRFGGGFDFYFTEKILGSIGVDYVLPTGDVEYLDYVSFGAGIQYRF